MVGTSMTVGTSTTVVNSSTVPGTSPAIVRVVAAATCTAVLGLSPALSSLRPVMVQLLILVEPGGASYGREN
jgi:hypothetical protein